ncbi:MAG: sulfite exporter TauE/SafE family protein [Clostridia bacterium]|nr:sulfite exporter TauE/SafE family protein [Clostridia bacterium]
MEIFLFILFGLLGGIVGGMGMGGGTLLIPLLTIFLSVEQKVAQSINLLAFIPMAIVALIIHFKNKMVVTKGILWIIIPGICFSVSFAFIASLLPNEVLHVLFGIFLILIAVYEAICLYFEKNKQKN